MSNQTCGESVLRVDRFFRTSGSANERRAFPVYRMTCSSVISLYSLTFLLPSTDMTKLSSLCTLARAVSDIQFAPPILLVYYVDNLFLDP